MTLSIAIICTAIIICFAVYKDKELEYKKSESEYARDALQIRTQVEVEQERTKQRLLDKEKEEERTKQLELKANYQKETGNSLW